MAETITPVVHGGRRKPYLVASGLHVFGSALSAALLGLALGALGAVLGGPWQATAWVVAAAGAVYAAREAFRLPIPLPDRKRQVPEWWRTFYSPAVAAFLYGAGLGVGFLTYLSFGTFAAVMAAALAAGDPLLGALLCLPFGLGRALAVLAVTWRATPQTIDRLDDVALSSGPRLVNAATLAAVAGTALAAAL